MTTLYTREGFLRKNIVAVSFFKTVLYTHILNTYIFHDPCFILFPADMVEVGSFPLAGPLSDVIRCFIYI